MAIDYLPHDTASDPISAHWKDLGWEIRDLDAAEIGRLDAAGWDMLAREAVDDNPYYARQYLLAGIETIDPRVRAISVIDDVGKLVGLFPYRRQWRAIEAAQNPYQFSGAPLVNRQRASTVLTAWLETLGTGNLPGAALIRNMPLESTTALRIFQTARALGHIAVETNAYSRPRLTRSFDDFEGHCASVFTSSRRRDLERAIRRLKEIGDLRHVRISDPDSVRAYVDRFLILEQAGWKGRAGTAFATRPETAAFARSAYGGKKGREGLGSIDALLLDGAPIALSVNVAGPTTLFTPKCTYDESLRRFSPGLVLEFMIIKEFYENSPSGFEAMDASTTVDSHVVQGLWNYSVRMGTLIVGRPQAVAAAAGLERAQLGARAIAKDLRDRLRRGFEGWRRKVRPT